MRKLHFTLAAALQLAVVLAQAQTSIGIPGPGDANVALHVRASATNTAGPIRLEGLKVGSSETNVLVTDVNGVLRYRSAASLMSAPTNTDLWVNNANVISPLSNRPVAIGQTGAASATDQLSVNGHTTLVAASQLRFRDGTNYIYSNGGTDWRFVTNALAKFRNRTDTKSILSIDGNPAVERVGILTDAPQTAFHVAATTPLTAAGGGVVRVGSNGDYVGVSSTQVNAYAANAVGTLHLQSEGNALVVGANNAASSLTDLRGRLRIGTLATNNAPTYVLSANGTGDVTRTDLAALSAASPWTRTAAGGPTFLVNAADNVGIGTNAPAGKLHVAQGTNGTDTELLLQQSTINQSAGIRLIEGAPTQDFGFHVRYEGTLNQLQFNRHLGATYLNIDRNTGNVAIGDGANTSASDRLLVANGDIRLRAANSQYFGDNNNIFLARFNNGANNDDYDIVNNEGGVHVHARKFQVTGQIGNLNNTALFDPAVQRVGVGTQVNPLSTLHITPRNADTPLRIDNLPTTPNNGKQYYRLLIDDNGIVYRTVATYQGNNGLIGGGGGQGPLAEHILAAASPEDDVAAENLALRREHDALRARVAELTTLVRRLEQRLDADRAPSADVH